jgi:geranylgeranyl pyrophosphate synthase
MNMEIIKKYRALIIIVLVVAAGIFFFFYRFHHHDTKALTDFVPAYEKFDKAIADFSIGETDDLESKASDALIELNTKASVRLSSLVENDAELMSKELEIADFSGKELDNLRAYKRAIKSKNADLVGLAKEYGDLTSKRKTAYARFQELAGLKD